MKTKFDYHVSLEDALRSKDLRHLRDFSVFILDIEDEEVDHLELEPLVSKIVGRFHKDVFAVATYDLLMTDIDFEEFFIGMIEDGPTRIPKNDRETIETLKLIPFVDVREIPCGRGHAVFSCRSSTRRICASSTAGRRMSCTSRSSRRPSAPSRRSDGTIRARAVRG